ncbi:MAG: hypothetical protein AB7O62_03325 [Pirellulales bacterium]
MKQATRLYDNRESVLMEIIQAAGCAKSDGPEQAARNATPQGNPLLTAGLFMAADGLPPQQINASLARLCQLSDEECSASRRRVMAVCGGVAVLAGSAWAVGQLSGASVGSWLWPLLGMLTALGMLSMGLMPLVDRMRSRPPGSEHAEEAITEQMIAQGIALIQQGATSTDIERELREAGHMAVQSVDEIQPLALVESH